MGIYYNVSQNLHLQVIFSTEKQDFEKRTQMQVNLECSARKYKSARASNFGKWFRALPILAKNLYNYYDGITVEGTYITNLQPDLNVQVPHKNCKFLCKCLSKPAARADSFPEIWGPCRFVLSRATFKIYLHLFFFNILFFSREITWRCKFCETL